MKAEAKPLAAKFLHSDRALVDAAIRSQTAEMRTLTSFPPPLRFSARTSRTRYGVGVRTLERRLRAVAAALDKWRVAIEPQVEVTSLRTLYDQHPVLAPTAVRHQLTRSDFLFVHLRGKLALAGGVPVRSVRLGLELDPGLAFKARRGMFYSLFPKSEGRLFRGSKVVFGLRPDLTFRVASTPEGAALDSRDRLPDSVRRLMLLGPMSMSFRKLALTGVGSGTNRAEWNFMVVREEARSSAFDLMAVLRVARGRNRIRTHAVVEAEVLMPELLTGVVGRTRLMRGVGHWSLPVPRSMARNPSRLD